jgi:hypothetical protein
MMFASTNGYVPANGAPGPTLPGSARSRSPTPLRSAFSRVARTATGSTVDRVDPRGPERERGDRQDAGAGPHVEHVDPRPPLQLLFQGNHAEPGRWVEPGPERHPGVEHDHDAIDRLLVLVPGSAHHHPPPDAVDVVMLLPGVRPIFLAPLRDAQLADRSQLPQRPECAADLRQLSPAGYPRRRGRFGP